MQKAVLAGKVRGYLSKQGYGFPPDKSGFDIYAIKEGLTNRHLAVGCNVNEEVTSNYVRAFMKKMADLYRKFMFAQLDGMIAYSGQLDKGAAALVKGTRPPIRFKKFR